MGGQQKGRQRGAACRKGVAGRLDVRLGLAEAHDAVARLPLAALAEDLDAFETLEDVAFDHESVGALEAFVL
jgi:hypothetical protein